MVMKNIAFDIHILWFYCWHRLQAVSTAGDTGVLYRYNLFIYDMIYLLTAIGLSPGGSSTVHIDTQTVHRTTQLTQTVYTGRTTQQFGRVQAVPRLCGLCPGICLTTEEKARKNLSQGSRTVPSGTMKIHNHTIRIHRHNNKKYINYNINPSDAELNPICHLLVLLGAHHIFHVSRISVKQEYNHIYINKK
jgi:hypothetical protein